MLRDMSKEEFKYFAKLILFANGILVGGILGTGALCEKALDAKYNKAAMNEDVSKGNFTFDITKDENGNYFIKSTYVHKYVDKHDNEYDSYYEGKNYVALNENGELNVFEVVTLESGNSVYVPVSEEASITIKEQIKENNILTR